MNNTDLVKKKEKLNISLKESNSKHAKEQKDNLENNKYYKKEKKISKWNAFIKVSILSPYYL